MKDLPKRTLTAIVFGVVMLGGIIWNEYSFLTLLLIVHIGCLWEYYSLVQEFQDYDEQKKKLLRIWLTAFGTLIFFILSTAFRFLVYVDEYLYFSIAPLLMLYFVFELFGKSKEPVKNAALNLAGIFYVSLPLACAVFFEYMNENEKWFPGRSGWILGILLLVWANDTFAYFAGTLLGKHKILPSISPKKSWEGFVGGLIATVATGFLLSNYFSQLDAAGWMITAVIVSVFGTAGDFVESMIKRNAGVKDSGKLLPGHGGFLDRFDAFIFCLPFVFLFYLLHTFLS